MDVDEQIAVLEREADFMARKLDETREYLERQQVVFTQKGKGLPKKNPMFDGYNSLMATYQRTLTQLNELRSMKPAKQAVKFSKDTMRVVGKVDAV